MMIKATELRIGNFIYERYIGADDVFTKENEVIEVDASSFAPIMKSPKFEFTPIPLTEEWLLKFGFESIEDGWYKKGDEQFSWNIYDHAIRFRGMWVSEPEYVHQLQNLYYALTGEELTIKHFA